MMQWLLVTALLFSTQTTAPADDFAFRLENKSCRYERIDSFEGTFSMFRAKPIPMPLSDQQRRAIFQAVTAWKFFDLPTFITPLPASGDIVGVWELEVRNDGRVHRVTGAFGAATFEQRRPLAKLADTISEVVRPTSPAIERLFRGGGCIGGSSDEGRPVRLDGTLARSRTDGP